MCPAAVYLIGIGGPFAAGFGPAVVGAVWEPADGTGAVAGDWYPAPWRSGQRSAGRERDAASFALVGAGRWFQSVELFERLRGNPGFEGGAVPSPVPAGDLQGVAPAGMLLPANNRSGASPGGRPRSGRRRHPSDGSPEAGSGSRRPATLAAWNRKPAETRSGESQREAYRQAACSGVQRPGYRSRRSETSRNIRMLPTG